MKRDTMINLLKNINNAVVQRMSLDFTYQEISGDGGGPLRGSNK